MSGLKKLIDVLEKEIKELESDTNYCKNDVTLRIINYAIEDREFKINKLKNKYGI